MGKSQFRYLSQEDILSLNIPYEQVIDTVEKAMGEFAKGFDFRRREPWNH